MSDAKSQTRSERAGLDLPVARLHNHMKMHANGKHISETAPVFATAAIEHILGVIERSAGEYADRDKKPRITPRHIMLAVRESPQLAEAFSSFIFLSSGMVPYTLESQVPRAPRRRKVKRARRVPTPEPAKAPKKAATAKTVKKVVAKRQKAAK